jgi:uncharacterized heparinase superfamily protein
VRDWGGMVRRGLRMPPRVIAKRIATELRGEFERLRTPYRRAFKLRALLDALEMRDLASLWKYLAALPYPAVTAPVERAVYDACCPGDSGRILARAEDALAHRVNMLGSGVVELGKDIDWLTDFRSGIGWSNAYYSDIDFSSPDDSADVKVPWELSRLQWLIPLGQAYLLTGEERYAQGARSVLEHWIDHNPYAGSVNWASTMEVALRILSMTWLFHVLNGTQAWGEDAFREKFLLSLYLHVEFVERHVGSSEVNAGVYTVSAAGLVFGGLFFGQGRDAPRWQKKGWAMCSGEITRQVYPDGVGFEGSVSYHRLAMEFFLLPALYRLKRGLSVDAGYSDRLLAMARYTAAYTKPDGMAPLWGDDGGTRAMPFGGQDINDHRFMIGLVGAAFHDLEVTALFSGPRAEIFWLLGQEAATALPHEPVLPGSCAFPDGGYFVMRSRTDHVFIDCAPVGLAGRGGHGHNDCLSFEAVFDGVPLVSDCGTYTYTASFTDRNAFRSTAYHNTPQIDEEEINRFKDPNWLWALHYDALPEVQKWEVDGESALFVGRHRGYGRLLQSVVPERTLLADFSRQALYLADYFDGEGTHTVSEPLHLAPGVEVTEICDDAVFLSAQEKSFCIRWNPNYALVVEDCRISPAYGVIVAATRLVWVRKDSPLEPFALFISPSIGAVEAEAAMRHRLDGRGLPWML